MAQERNSFNNVLPLRCCKLYTGQMQRGDSPGPDRSRHTTTRQYLELFEIPPREVHPPRAAEGQDSRSDRDIPCYPEQFLHIQDYPITP